jgi:uncharacterized protein (DUF1684 family)
MKSKRVKSTLGFGLALSIFSSALAQTPDSALVADILFYQSNLTREYRDSAETPLDKKALAEFKGHEFFPVDLSYRVNATFRRTPDEEIFKMKTTGPKTPEYVKYGEAIFMLNGERHTLNVYQNIALSQREEYRDHLFLPFTDNTNGLDTYGGGRYIDLVKPAGDSIVVDFNKAYNPYCAYSDKYSCPIPPKENHLDTEIKAGIMLREQH